MKLLKTFLLSLIVLGVSATGYASENSTSIDCPMRGEMFLWGTFHVHDANGNNRGAFQVKYLPGAGNIVKDGAQHWCHAKDALGQYFEGEKFWENKVWVHATAGVKWGWDVNAENGIGAIPRDFQALWADFESAKVTEFGGLGHKILDCAGMLASLVCRPIIGTAAMAVGVLESVIATPIAIALPALTGAAEATVPGAAWPVLKMVWNGTAWVATQIYTHTPPEKDSLIVSWVPATT